MSRQIPATDRHLPQATPERDPQEPLGETPDEQPADAAQHRLLVAPRFTLRTLLLSVGGLSVLFAVMSMLGTTASVLLIWMLLLVAAHVVANAWGVRAPHAREEIRADDRAPDPRPLPRLPAPLPRLAGHFGIGKLMIAATCLGAVVGGIAGGYVLGRIYWPQVSIAAILLGTLSAAVLGGFFGFMISSFLQVFAKALSEATTEPKQ